MSDSVLAEHATELPEDLPPVLRGGFEPVSRELYVRDLKVIGEVPKDLNGAYFRNGPNRMFAAEGRYHWYDGDGMVHAAYFDNGRVSYRNRWVRTEPLKEEMRAGRALWKGLRESVALGVLQTNILPCSRQTSNNLQ